MTVDEFFAIVLRGLGMDPTPWRLAALRAWAQKEGMLRAELSPHRRLDFHWNPLATTQPGRRKTDNPFGAGPGKWNNANPPLGVGIYADALAGAEATVDTLTNGFYPNILLSLKAQSPIGAAVNDFVTYVGSRAYGEELLAEWAALTESKTFNSDDTTATKWLVAVVAGHGATNKKGERLTGLAALEDQYQRGNSLARANEIVREQLADLTSQVLALAIATQQSDGALRQDLIDGLGELLAKLRPGGAN